MNMHSIMEEYMKEFKEMLKEFKNEMTKKENETNVTIQENKKWSHYLPIEIWKLNNQFIVIAFIPKLMNNQNYRIEFINNMSLKIKVNLPKQLPYENANLIFSDIGQNVERIITLPQAVNSSDYYATAQNGVLTIFLYLLEVRGHGVQDPIHF